MAGAEVRLAGLGRQGTAAGGTAEFYKAAKDSRGRDL
jgi:hypothetical protein